MQSKGKNDFARGLEMIQQSLGKERVKMDQSLKDYTFSKSLGHAQALYIATNEVELVKILDISFQLKVPVLMLGNGTKSVFADKIAGLVVKNRTAKLKVVAFKGQVAREGIGIKEALIEVASGVSISRLNEFLINQGLMTLDGISSPLSSVGGSLFWDLRLQVATEKIRVWEQGSILEIDNLQLKRTHQVILSVIIKAKSITK